MKNNSSLTSVEQRAFEKVRYEYCAKMFESDKERKESLEKKSQFYLSYISLFLGTIFLNLDFLVVFKKFLFQGNYHVIFVSIIYILVAVIAISLLASLVGILVSLQVKGYKDAYPVPIVSSLFVPDSGYLQSETEINFLNATATSLAITLEFNSRLNDKKAKWVKFTSASILVSIISLALVLTVVTYLSIFM